MRGLVNQGCVDNCNRAYCENKPSQPRPYGSIAYGDHGVEGISWNKGSEAEADQFAVGDCSKRGTNCRVVFRYRETCAALSVASGFLHYESATGATEKDAENNANAACRQKWGTCASNLSACSLTGARPANPPPVSAISWGAIAYSAADYGAGHSQSKSDQASAEREAMAMCAERGKHCVLETSFNKQCGALAADGTVTGVGVSPDQREALQKAMDACKKAGGARCAPHIAFCSM
jgi:hypothetical protein